MKAADARQQLVSGVLEGSLKKENKNLLPEKNPNKQANKKTPNLKNIQ